MRTSRTTAMSRAKIKSLSQLKKIIHNLKKNSKKIVFTNGCFDLLHRGHVLYLEKAKKMGDILVVGLNSDSSLKKIKGKLRPITREKDRAEILAALECVDYVLIFSEKTPYKVIAAIKPDIIVKGADWNLKNIVGAKLVHSYGGQVIRVPFLKGYSTTTIIDKIVKRFSKTIQDN